MFVTIAVRQKSRYLTSRDWTTRDHNARRFPSPQMFMSCFIGCPCVTPCVTVNVRCCAKWNINLCRSVFRTAAVDEVAEAQLVLQDLRCSQPDASACEILQWRRCETIITVTRNPADARIADRASC